ncbi:MAG TPA: class I SAM-dependent methyltransferase [Geobacteraceae bacterium]
MNEDRIRWNERYAGEDYTLGTSPSPFLAEQLDFLLACCPGRHALDVACGEGRNSVFLARHGFRVTGIDIAERGLEKGRALMAKAGVVVDFRHEDLESADLGGPYDLVINFNFLLRELIPKLVAALAPGGILLFDTILAAAHAPVPAHKDHLLKPGELGLLFSSYDGTILRVEEFPETTVPTARLMFRKASPSAGAA